MPSQRKKYQTQWAAQFFAAAEICRRGHMVALTLGNAPQTDLVAISPAGNKYRVEIKGLSEPNWWLISPHRQAEADLYFVLVHVPKDLTAPHFFILSSAEMVQEMAPVLAEIDAKGLSESGAGLRWKQGLPYENHWQTLPE